MTPDFDIRVAPDRRLAVARETAADGSDEAGILHVDSAALEGAKQRFADHAEAFDHSIDALGRAYDRLLTGSGETRDDFELGAAEFLLGWRETLQVCAETSRIIRRNVGGYQLDLSQADEELAFDIAPRS